jgi:hypothetical protein
MGGGSVTSAWAEHFASFIRLSLDEPVAVGRLQVAAGDLADTARFDSLLPKILEGAMALTADFGDVQIFDPATGALRIVAHSGFGSEFLDYFSVVDDAGAACGRR